MKLLLTSGGLTNQKISDALLELAGRPAAELNLVFVPTAANVEAGDKDWLLNDYANIGKQGFKSVDIVDISAIPKKMWLPRIEAADILFFGGGNTYHLMHWINKSGLAELLPELLKTRVYVGLSAGSMVTSLDLMLSSSQNLYNEDLDKTEETPGLKFVGFYFMPHLNSPYFPKVSKPYIEEEASKLSAPLYALDDQCALKVVDGKVEIIGDGEALKYGV